MWDDISGPGTTQQVALNPQIQIETIGPLLESDGFTQTGGSSTITAFYNDVPYSLTNPLTRIIMLGAYNNNYIVNSDYGAAGPVTSIWAPIRRQFTDNTFGGALSEFNFNSLELNEEFQGAEFPGDVPENMQVYNYPTSQYLSNNDFYLRIGSEGGEKELIRIVGHYSHYGYDDGENPLMYLALERGALNTPILSHSAGDLVELGTLGEQNPLVFLADYFDPGGGELVNEYKNFRPYLDSMVGSYIRFTVGSIDQDYEGESYTNPPAEAALWPDDPYYYQFVDRQQYNIEVLEVNYTYPVGGVLDSFLTVYQGWRATLEDEFRPSHLFNVSLSGFEYNPDSGEHFYPNPHTNVGSGSYWDGSSIERTFSEESSVGQIFIVDNSDLDLVDSCQLELNTGNLSGKAIDDSSGNLNKGLLIGDYKIKKHQRNRPMRRSSFIKIPKKNNNKNGAL